LPARFEDDDAVGIQCGTQPAEVNVHRSLDRTGGLFLVQKKGERRLESSSPPLFAALVDSCCNSISGDEVLATTGTFFP